MFAEAGFSQAIGEVTLVLFTTLAPSGAVAFMIMAACLIAAMRKAPAGGFVRRTEAMLVVPIVVTMVGLVASATHLGNPANALYVFSRIGKSPLSTEVACAVAFLALAGVYWLYSFSLKPRPRLRQIWLALAIAAGAVFVTAVAFAYHVDTIASWHTPYIPLSIWSNALAGGPLLAACALQAAERGAFGEGDREQCGEDPLSCVVARRVVAVLSIVASAASIALYVAHGVALSGMANSLTTPLALAPAYWPCVAVFAAVSLGATGATVVAEVRRRDLSLAARIALCVAMLAGIFVMRFVFYMTHMTV